MTYQPSPRVHLDLSYDAVTERFVVDGRHDGYLYEELATGKHPLDVLERARQRWHEQYLPVLRARASELEGMSPIDAAILTAKRCHNGDDEFNALLTRTKIV
jgi:hypothetical protein